MIQAVIFDLDNTLLDFMNMKMKAVESGVHGMIEAGLQMNSDDAKEKIINIYEEKGWEYQEVFDDFIQNELGELDYKILASGIVAYRKAREASLICPTSSLVNKVTRESISSTNCCLRSRKSTSSIISV